MQRKAQRDVVIISLGEVVTPDISKAIGAFVELLASKLRTTDFQPDPKYLLSLVVGVIKSKNELINDFKRGDKTEEDFTNQMIAALETASGVRVTVAEFDHAWSQMCPSLSQFARQLDDALALNSDKIKLVLVSDTNPKDMRALDSQLGLGGYDRIYVNGQLDGIDDVPLITSYTRKQSKTRMVLECVKRERGFLASMLAQSMSAVVSGASNTEMTNIIYVCGNNEILDPVLKANLDSINEALRIQNQALAVETLVWDKKAQTLPALLQDTLWPRPQVSVASRH